MLKIVKRCISSSSYLCKRKGGNSGLTKPRYTKRKSTPKKTTVHQHGTKALPKVNPIQKLSENEELTKEYDAAYESLFQNHAGLMPPEELKYEKSTPLAEIDTTNLTVENDFVLLLQIYAARGDVESIDDLYSSENQAKLEALTSASSTNLLIADSNTEIADTVIPDRNTENCSSAYDTTSADSIENSISTSDDTTSADGTEIARLDEKTRVKEINDTELALKNEKNKAFINSVGHVYRIKAYGVRGDVDGAVQYYGKLKKDGVSLTGEMKTALMDGLVKSKKMELAEGFLSQLKEDGEVPSSCYAVLIRGYMDIDFKKGFALFHEMRRDGVEICSFAFNGLLYGYAKGGEVEKAIGVLEDMRQCEVPPSHITYNMLIQVCARSSYHCTKAINFLHRMKADGYFPDEYSYNGVLQAAGRLGDVEAMKKIMDEMVEYELPMTERTYSIILNGYGMANVKNVFDVTPSRVLRRKIIQDEKQRKLNLEKAFDTEPLLYNDKGEPNSTHNIDKENRLNEEFENAAYQMNHMQIDDEEEEPEEEPKEESKDLVVDVEQDFQSAQKTNLAEATALYQQMTLNNTTITTCSLNSMLNVYTNALRIRTALDFVNNEFPKHNATKDIHTYRSLIRMHVRTKRFKEAVDVLFEMRKNNIKPDSYIYGHLLHAYAKAGKLEHCIKLLRSIHGKITIPEKYLVVLRRLAAKHKVISHYIPVDPLAHFYPPGRTKYLATRRIYEQQQQLQIANH